MQAIATAKRLGAVVEAYDVRSATKDQVKSLGAKFIDTGVSAEGAGGYARELTSEEKLKQQEILDARIAASDAVISTASVPGRAAPRIISKAAVERMIEWCRIGPARARVDAVDVERIAAVGDGSFRIR